MTGWICLVAGAVALVVAERLLAATDGRARRHRQRMQRRFDRLVQAIESGASLMSVVDSDSARQRLGQAINAFWQCDGMHIHVQRPDGAWEGLDGDPREDPGIADGQLVLPAENGGILVLSCLAGDRVVLIAENCHDQPPLTGLGLEERRELAELLRTQLALTLRRVFLMQRLEELGRVDALTGCVRRWYVEARLAELVEDGQVVAVAMLDIDHFKEVNDRHGHAVGDDVLRACADRLRQQLRANDLVGRFGGEEFIIVLPQTLPVDAKAICDRLRRSIAEAPMAGRGITVSIGLAWAFSDDFHLDLIERADQSLYRAKEGGRDRVAWQDVDTGTRFTSRITRAVRKDGDDDRSGES